MERSMTRSFTAAGLGILVLVAAIGTSANAQSKLTPEPEVASLPSTNAFASLSAGNKRIATALFEAQTTAKGATPMTLQQIAQERLSGRKWGDVFQAMKSQGLIQAETLGQVLGRYDRARHPKS
jgi:hypothetical protein